MPTPLPKNTAPRTRTSQIMDDILPLTRQYAVPRTLKRAKPLVCERRSVAAHRVVFDEWVEDGDYESLVRYMERTKIPEFRELAMEYLSDGAEEYAERIVDFCSKHVPLPQAVVCVANYANDRDVVELARLAVKHDVSVTDRPGPLRSRFWARVDPSAMENVWGFAEFSKRHLEVQLNMIRV